MNKETPFVSVIMATYNDNEDYLSKAIDSILYQTYTNFEFIICDDSTNQETINLLNQYKLKDERIKIIRGEKRLGFVRSLNEAIKHAKGEWIARMDSDDISFPNRLEEELKYISDDVGVIASQCINIDAEGNKKGIIIKVPTSKTMFRIFFMLGKTPIVHPTALINRNHLLRLTGYDENFKVMEDFELWARLYDSNLKLINITTPLLYYRIHGNNAHTTKADLVKRVKCVCLIKFAYNETDVLNESTFNGLMNVVANDSLCKILRLDENKHSYLKTLRKFKIYPELPLLLVYLKYKYFGKKKLTEYNLG